MCIMTLSHWRRMSCGRSLCLRGFLATRAGRFFLAVLVAAVGIHLPLMTFRGYQRIGLSTLPSDLMQAWG